MNVLITGFKAFAGESLNPSEILLQDWGRGVFAPSEDGSSFQAMPLLPEVLNFASSADSVDTLLLPVSYQNAFLTLQNFLHEQRSQHQKVYAAVLMLGQAGGRSAIGLERTAMNWRESALPDEVGYRPLQGQKIRADGDNAYFSSLPLEKMKEALESARIPVEISFSAGAFVCNQLFYEACEYLQPLKIACGFVHIPYLPEQVLTKPDKASMEFETMRQALKLMVQSLISAGTSSPLNHQ